MTWSVGVSVPHTSLYAGSRLLLNGKGKKRVGSQEVSKKRETYTSRVGQEEGHMRVPPQILITTPSQKREGRKEVL